MVTYLKSSIHFIQMSSPYLRFTNGALRVKGITRVEFQEPAPVFTTSVQVATIPVVEAAPEPAPAPAPAPEPAPESNVEAPAEVAEAAPESGLVPEDPPA